MQPMNYYHEYEDEFDVLYMLVVDIFKALAVTCFLYAMQKIAAGVMLGARVRAYEALSEAYSPEEREVLIHKTKVNSLHY